MHSLIWANIQDKRFFIRLCVKLKKMCPNARAQLIDERFFLLIKNRKSKYQNANEEKVLSLLEKINAY